MNDKIDKTTLFNPGDKVIARGTFGVPASPRLFRPMKDAAKEYEEYAELVKTVKPEDKRLSKFMSNMVFLPSEGGGRYRIVEGEQYEIRVEGKYGELFHKPQPKKKNEPKETQTSVS